MEKATLPIVLGVTILAIATAGAIYVSNIQKSIKFTGRAGTEKSAVLYIWPIETKTAPGEEASVNLSLTTEGEEVDKTQVQISWDPEIASLKAIQNGVTFNLYTNKEIDNEKGIASVQAKGIFSGAGTLAKLVFSGKKVGSTEISISNTASKIINKTETNILQGVNNGTLVVE
ncbi:MAG: hypothetical protein ACOC6Q_01575 [Patescibacteria group bacterium]